MICDQIISDRYIHISYTSWQLCTISTQDSHSCKDHSLLNHSLSLLSPFTHPDNHNMTWSDTCHCSLVTSCNFVKVETSLATPSTTMPRKGVYDHCQCGSSTNFFTRSFGCTWHIVSPSAYSSRWCQRGRAALPQQ